MPEIFPPDFIERLLARIADPAGRTDRWNTSPITSYLGGAFETRRVQLGGDPARSPPPLPPPATDEDLDSAQASLGFPVPPDLADLYRRAANGGFGPDDGLASLDQMADQYRDLIATSPDDDGAAWPDYMLPIGQSGPGTDCYDMKTGRIVYWDREESLDEYGEPTFEHSLVVQAETLQAWLEAWLSRPPFAERMKLDMESALLDNMRTTLTYWREKSPEERAEFGLSEEGWEEELFGHLGIDLDDL